jgi:hypothetical protein
MKKIDWRLSSANNQSKGAQVFALSVGFQVFRSVFCKLALFIVFIFTPLKSVCSTDCCNTLFPNGCDFFCCLVIIAPPDFPSLDSIPSYARTFRQLTGVYIHADGNDRVEAHLKNNVLVRLNINGNEIPAELLKKYLYLIQRLFTREENNKQERGGFPSNTEA